MRNRREAAAKHSHIDDINDDDDDYQRPWRAATKRPARTGMHHDL